MGFPSSVTATDWYERFGERIKCDLAFALTMYMLSTTSALHLSSHRHLRAAPVVIVFLMCFIVFAESFLAGFPKWYVCLLAYAFYHNASSVHILYPTTFAAQAVSSCGHEVNMFHQWSLLLRKFQLLRATIFGLHPRRYTIWVQIR